MTSTRIMCDPDQILAYNRQVKAEALDVTITQRSLLGTDAHIA